MTISLYDIFLRSLMLKSAQMRAPTSGTLELTPRCTLDCKMCYIHSKENDINALSSEKSTKWWLDLIDVLKKEGTLTILITGGEPLLRNDFDEIYKKCSLSGMITQVNTNGTLIDDNKINLFKEYLPGVINITLYGASDETYEKLCSKAKYNTVINAIKRLKQENIPVRVNYSVTQLNKDDLEACYAVCKELDVPFRATSYMFPPTRKLKGNYTDYRLSPKEAAEFAVLYRKLSDPEQFEIIKEHLKKDGSIKLQDDECLTIPGERINCMAGAASYWITYDGYLTPCGMLNTPRIKITDFKKNWEELKLCREEIVLPAECSNCKIKNMCESCAASVLAETGSFSKVPKYLCEKTKHYYKLLINQ